MKFLSLLGMAQASGRLVSGSAACYEALERRSVHLLVLADDASHGTRRRFLELAKRLQVPCIESRDKAELGRAIGKPDRSVVAVCDAGLARSLRATLGLGSGE